MGQSTNAIMAFGFDLGEELPDSFVSSSDNDGDEDGDEGSFEADEFLLRHYAPDFPGWTADASKGYWDRRKAAMGAIPVDIIAHCSGEYPMYFLAVRGTDITALRGSPSEATQGAVSQEQIDALRAFCERHGIEWKAPSWHIFSMWN